MIDLDYKDAEIDRLHAEIDRLQDKVCNRDRLIVMHKELEDSQRAKIERLTAALKPFVEFLATYPRPRIPVSADDTIIISACDVYLTLGDLDRAKAALAGKGERLLCGNCPPANDREHRTRCNDCPRSK